MANFKVSKLTLRLGRLDLTLFEKLPPRWLLLLNTIPKAGREAKKSSVDVGKRLSTNMVPLPSPADRPNNADKVFTITKDPFILLSLAWTSCSHCHAKGQIFYSTFCI